MTDKQENKLGMLLKVQNFLATYSTQLAGVTQIATLAGNLDTVIDDIFDAEGIATSDTTGVTENKADLRTDVIEQTLQLAAIGAAYYYSIGDRKGLRAADYTQSTLENLRDSALYTRAKQLVKQLTPVAASLAPFNASPTAVGDLNFTADAYLGTLAEPKREIEHKSSQGKMVDQYLNDSDDIIEGLTVYVNTFRASQPAIVLEFDAATRIDDTGALYRTYDVALDANGAAILTPFNYHPKKKVTVTVATAGVAVELGVPNATETGFLAGSNTSSGGGSFFVYHNYFTGSKFTKLRLFNQTATAGMVKVKG